MAQKTKDSTFSRRSKECSAATVVLALSMVLQQCNGQRVSETSPASARPVAVVSADLPHPISCESWEAGGPNDPLAGMPKDVIRQVAEGKGLPAKFYTDGEVPPDFCRPVNGVWKFPGSSQRFYNADVATLRQQKVPPQDAALIEAIVSRTLASDRIYIKWMHDMYNGRLIVFSMKPTNSGVYYSSGEPYIVLNARLLVDPADGEVKPPPPTA
jgi:hypothetical protein